MIKEVDDVTEDTDDVLDAVAQAVIESMRDNDALFRKLAELETEHG